MRIHPHKKGNPMICPECNGAMDITYDDGAGDYGDEVEEILTCEECGYELRHAVGSPVYHDGDSYVTFNEEADDES
jgi:hypothetical protein